MTPPVTSREEILFHCRQLVMAHGMDAISMRSVASSCGVALGSLYNYFPSKADLTMATVESVWSDIFYGVEQPAPFDCFMSAVNWVYDSLNRANLTYPGFFTLHSLRFASGEKQSARQLMQAHFTRIKQRLLAALQHDPHIRKDAFDDQFTPERLAAFAFHSVVASVLQGEGDMAALRGLIHRTLY